MKTDRRSIRYALVGLTIGLLAILAINRIAYTATVASQIRSAQKTNTQTLNQSREVLHAIRDCTEPSGECYRRGKQQTADAVSNINRVIILAAACASGLPPNLAVEGRQSAIQACVINRLSAQQRHR